MWEKVAKLNCKFIVSSRPSFNVDILTKVLPTGNIHDASFKCKYYEYYEQDGRRGFLLEDCKGDELFEVLAFYQEGFSEQTVKKIMG